MMFRFRSLPAALAIALAPGSCLAAGADGDGIRTFEFSAHRTRIMLVDDEQVLFNWSIDQYFEEMRAQEERGENGPPVKIQWVTPYDGIIWGRSDTNFAAQWYGRRRAGDIEYWKFFHNPDRQKAGFRFPAATRLMGMTDTFVYHGWCNVALDFYAPHHEGEFRTVWMELAVAQQIFLSCAAPDDAFRKYAVGTHPGAFSEHQEDLADGRSRRVLKFTLDGGLAEFTMHIDSAGADAARQPAAWRFVRRNFHVNESLVFFGEWRETTMSSRRTLPELPKQTLASHHDVERIDSVGVRDRTGLGPWGQEHPTVQYLSSSPGIDVYNWFSANHNRVFTNGHRLSHCTPAVVAGAGMSGPAEEDGVATHSLPLGRR